MSNPASKLLKAVIPVGARRKMQAAGRAVAGYGAKARRRLKRPNVFDGGTAERVGVVFDNPSEMSVSERLFLYSLIRGTRPARILEIGSRQGGSASIMAAALEDAGAPKTSKIFGVDPGPDITVPARLFHGRFDLIVEPSPSGIATAHARAGGDFTFALIDGLHIYTQLKLDLEATLAHLAEGSYILLHDAFHRGIAMAIREAVEANPHLHDCGYPCATPWIEEGAPLAYGGFRMLRYGLPVVDADALVNAEAQRRSITPPPADDDLADHDPYWHCKRVRPCAYCRKRGITSVDDRSQAQQ